MEDQVRELLEHGFRITGCGNEEWKKELYQRMRVEGARVYWGKDWESVRAEVEACRVVTMDDKARKPKQRKAMSSELPTDPRAYTIASSRYYLRSVRGGG